MTEEQYTYDFDPQASNPNNLVVNEQHVLSPPEWHDYYFIVPKAAPFFSQDFEIVHQNTGRTLVEGEDFHFTHKFNDAIVQTAKGVYGSITFLDKSLTGAVTIRQYRTLGGQWVLDQSKIVEILSNIKQNPRVTTWEMIADLPERFPPIDHQWHIDDLVGMSDVRNAILQIAENISGGDGDGDGGGSGGSVHASRTDNPHHVTKQQIGLDSVQNYPIATQSQAEGGDYNAAYMTPLRVKQLLDSSGATSAGDHVSARNNPHNVSKTQVGLGNVDNFTTATSNEAIQGSSVERFMTPKTTADAIEQRLGVTVNEHISSRDNPHGVNKIHVGLGNLSNYPIATESEARNATLNNRYMTPLRTKQLVEETSGSQVSQHSSRTDNPHDVTKSQVGLDNVENLPLASETVARVADSNAHYATPRSVKWTVDELIGQSLDQHTSRTDNPHGVTKQQVGLGNVQNFGIASNAEASDGTSNTVYLTPSSGKSLVDTFAIVPLNNHASNNNNPHNVSKAQVGLDSVENLPLATTQQAINGGINTAYMTPLRTREQVNAVALEPLNNHVTNSNNPHGVTKSQVGLGSVQNYPVATQTQAVAGTSDSVYMTPLKTEALVADRVSGQVSGHASRTDNPHGVTASQIGAYTTIETDNLLSQKLNKTGTAANSTLHEGLSVLEVINQALSAATASDVGLGNVTNTSDVDKPVSTLQQAALDEKVAFSDVIDNLNSTDVTRPLSANRGRELAVQVSNILTTLSSDDTTLDELQEIVDFIKANKSDLENLSIANIAGLQTALDSKVEKVAGKVLSDENYTASEKNKLSNIQAGAEANVATNLTVGGSGDSRSINSSTGSNASLPLSSSTTAGLMSTSQHDQLASLQSQFDTMVSDMTTAFSVAAGELQSL